MATTFPTLTKVAVSLKYRTKTHTANLTMASGADCAKPMTPNRTLAAAAAEIARIAEIAGCGADLLLAVTEAIKAVQDDRLLCKVAA